MVEDTQKRYADDVTVQELVRLRVENEKLKEMLRRVTNDREMHRAAVEAGYADLKDYIEKWSDK